MEARVAVLEQIAKDTKDTLVEIRADMRDLKADMRDLRQSQRTDFLWLLGGMAGLLAVMAHGFHWL